MGFYDVLMLTATLDNHYYLSLDHHSLSLLIITTLFLSFVSFYIVVRCTNDIDISCQRQFIYFASCQQQFIYFAWHGLYLLTFHLVTATVDHYYSLSLSPSYRSIIVV